MKDELTEQQINAVLAALDKAIKAGPWDESTFLRVIGKNLREIRDDFASKVNLHGSEKAKTESHVANRVALRAGQQEVFISLYASEGSKLSVWERILANLQHQTISRPIYTDEDNIRYLIKSKKNKVNEGYVAIYVNQQDILVLSPDKMTQDKFGNPLISLKDKAINLENISRFVHVSGSYHYLKGHLVKNHSAE